MRCVSPVLAILALLWLVAVVAPLTVFWMSIALTVVVLVVTLKLALKLVLWIAKRCK